MHGYRGRFRLMLQRRRCSSTVVMGNLLLYSSLSLGSRGVVYRRAKGDRVRNMGSRLASVGSMVVRWLMVTMMPRLVVTGLRGNMRFYWLACDGFSTKVLALARMMVLTSCCWRER